MAEKPMQTVSRMSRVQLEILVLKQYKSGNLKAGDLLAVDSGFIQPKILPFSKAATRPASEALLRASGLATGLSSELHLRIFTCLDTRDLVNVWSTCAGWRSSVLTQPTLWQQLDLQPGTQRPRLYP